MFTFTELFCACHSLLVAIIIIVNNPRVLARSVYERIKSVVYSFYFYKYNNYNVGSFYTSENSILMPVEIVLQFLGHKTV